MATVPDHRAGHGPAETDPYKDCAVYLEHGACVCSTGYPALCQADTSRDTEAPTSPQVGPDSDVALDHLE